MRLRWPFMLKKTHDARVTDLIKDIQSEYDRAMEDGKRQIRAYAVDANYNLYNTDNSLLRPRVTATLQDIISQFRPVRRDYGA